MQVSAICAKVSIHSHAALQLANVWSTHAEAESDYVVIDLDSAGPDEQP